MQTTKPRTAKKLWYVNIYDIGGELVVGTPFSTYEGALMDAHPYWVETATIDFEYTEGEDK